MLRNETASSLGSRIIGDEREEIIETNKTQTMLTRFFTNRNYEDELVASKQNFTYSTKFPNSGKFDNQMSFNEFKTNNSNKNNNFVTSWTSISSKQVFNYELFQNINEGSKSSHSVSRWDRNKQKDNFSKDSSYSTSDFAEVSIIQRFMFDPAENLQNLLEYVKRVPLKLTNLNLLLTQYNHEMLTPFHRVIKSKDANKINNFISLLKQHNVFTNEIFLAGVGHDKQPLIHFLGVILKPAQIDEILHNNHEIDLFSRNKRVQPPILFDCYANNNFDNHKRWVILKHQKRVWINKFQKPWRTIQKIRRADRDFLRGVHFKPVAKMQSNFCSDDHTFESEIHTYSDVLKILRANNIKDMEIKRMLKLRMMKKAMNRAKILQKEIANETEIFEGTFVEDSDLNSVISDQANETFEDQTEDTQPKSNIIHGALSHMILCPKK